MSTGEEKSEVGFHSWSFAGLPLDEALRHIRDTGFAEVDIEARDGNADWSHVIKSLRKVNYKGVFMMEIQEARNPDELAKKCFQRAAHMLAGNDLK